MKRKLKVILLIDDDEATNYIHKRVIKETNCAETIVIKENGIEALDYLTSAVNGKFPQPDLIFLDINMPAMDGWEFLESYKKLNDDQLAKTVIVMLTTSLNPDDKDKASTIPIITDFIPKPLDPEMVEQICNNYFESDKEL
ncbi:MAG: response regulator [Flavobacteriaceae bacterium]|nr:response regulator [Flavobacteriaceae bacterium]